MAKFYKSGLLLILFLVCIVWHSSAKPMKKTVIITINAASLDDFLNNKDINNIARNGYIGLMSSKSNGKINQYKPYLTIGSGEKGEVNSGHLVANKADELVIEKYQNITGIKCNPGSIVNLSINRIANANSKTLYNAIPGKLGSILRSNGMKTAFIGGYFRGENFISPAFLIAMDRYGLSDYGDLIDTSNIDGVLNSFKKNYSISDFLVIELGNIENLYTERNIYFHTAYELNWNKQMELCGKVIKSIKESINFSNTVLLILSPFSPDKAGKSSELLCPLVLYDGGENSGVLMSKTTRREGIISTLDIAPAVLEYFNIDNSGFIGYPLKAKNVANNTQYIERINNITTDISVLRIRLLKFFAILIIIFLLFYIINCLKNIVSESYVDLLISFCLLLPFSMLIEGALRISSMFLKAAFIAFLSFILSLIINKSIKNDIIKVAAIAGINVFALIIDIISGQNMLKYSLLGYDPIIGARFYGMGNEYLGVFVSCTLLFCGCISQLNKNMKKILITLMIFSAFVTGLPWLGSNVGGFVTAVFGYIMFILLENKYNIKKAFMISISMVLIGLIFVAASNIFFTGLESHFGVLFKQIKSDGLIYLYNIAERKIKMAGKIVRYTIWSRVLIALIFGSVIIIVKAQGYIKNYLVKIGHIKNSWISLIMACAVAILFNDSGIITAALMMFYGVFSMMIMNNRKIQ
ncbi:MAG TPA: hypothetical protein DD426_14060 [Clostridiaceae bacterium]|nr:hypothetical protein [Clostridiaceae bacterium]